MSRTITASVELETCVKTKDSVSREIKTVVPCSAEVINQLIESNQLDIQSMIGNNAYTVSYDEQSKQLVLKVESQQTFATKKQYNYYAHNDKQNRQEEITLETRLKKEFEAEKTKEQEQALKKVIAMLEPKFESYSKQIIDDANKIALMQAISAMGFKGQAVVDEHGNYQIIAEN
jgi:hypothetical protein